MSSAFNEFAELARRTTSKAFCLLAGGRDSEQVTLFVLNPVVPEYSLMTGRRGVLRELVLTTHGARAVAPVGPDQRPEVHMPFAAKSRRFPFGI